MSDEQKFYESHWNPVSMRGPSRMGKGNESYKISTTHVSSSWYNKALDSTGVRKTRLRHFFDMDKTVEISKALDILAEDISSENADNETSIEVKYDDNITFKKTTIKLIESVKDIWIERTKFDRRLFQRVRKTLKYGATFYQEKADGSLREIHPERIVGYICDQEDDETITHYIEDPSVPLMDDIFANRHVSGIATHQSTKESDYITHPVDTLVILKVGDGPYGKSILEPVYKVWRQQTLIEDAILIYRVTRAAEKRVYYIDTGNLSGPRRQQAIEQQRMKLMQKQITQTKTLDGGIDSQYDPHSTVEDIFIPTNSQGKGSRVEVLPGASNINETRDLDYFVRKLASGLRIPTSMIDTQSDEQSSGQYSDMRVGTIYAVEMRYLGHVKRMARVFSFELTRNFLSFSTKRNVVIPKGVCLVLNDPNSFAKYKDMEVMQQSLNLVSSTSQIQSFSKRYVLEKFMYMDEEELRRNEEMKLNELGFDEDQIKKMEEFDIFNIVYGDGRAATKYGMEAPPEQEQGYGF